MKTKYCLICKENLKNNDKIVIVKPAIIKNGYLGASGTSGDSDLMHGDSDLMHSDCYFIILAKE